MCAAETGVMGSPHFLYWNGFVHMCGYFCSLLLRFRDVYCGLNYSKTPKPLLVFSGPSNLSGYIILWGIPTHCQNTLIAAIPTQCVRWLPGFNQEHPTHTDNTCTDTHTNVIKTHTHKVHPDLSDKNPAQPTAVTFPPSDIIMRCTRTQGCRTSEGEFMGWVIFVP